MGVVSPVVRKCWLEGVGAGLVQVTAAALGLGVEVVLASPEATIPFTTILFLHPCPYRLSAPCSVIVPEPLGTGCETDAPFVAEQSDNTDSLLAVQGHKLHPQHPCTS